LTSIISRTGNTYDAFKFEDWLVGELSVVALLRIYVHGHAAAYEGRLVLLFGFDPADKVSEITVFFEDPIAAERFFGPVAESAVPLQPSGLPEGESSTVHFPFR
jgi:hypothetical protein